MQSISHLVSLQSNEKVCSYGNMRLSLWVALSDTLCCHDNKICYYPVVRLVGITNKHACGYVLLYNIEIIFFFFFVTFLDSKGIRKYKAFKLNTIEMITVFTLVNKYFPYTI